MSKISENLSLAKKFLLRQFSFSIFEDFSGWVFRSKDISIKKLLGTYYNFKHCCINCLIECLLKMCVFFYGSFHQKKNKIKLG